MLFRDLLTLLDHTYAAPRVTRLYVVVDNYCIHKAKAVEQWLASHPRFDVAVVADLLSTRQSD